MLRVLKTAGLFSLFALGAALLWTGCPQGGGEDEVELAAALTIRGEEQTGEYAVRIFPYPAGGLSGIEDWSELTHDGILLAAGEAQADNYSAVVPLKRPDGGSFAGNGRHLAAITFLPADGRAEELRYGAANFKDGSASVRWAQMTAPSQMPSITLTQIGTYVFPPAPAGYEEQPALPVAVFNTGGAATGALSITLSGMAEAFFIVPSSLESIGPSGSAYFSVAPAVGLAAGVYSATVTVGSASGSAGIVPQSFGVSFEVEGEGGGGGEFDYDIALDPSGSRYDFPTRSVNYTDPPSLNVGVTNTGTGPVGPLSVSVIDADGSASASFSLSPASLPAIEPGDKVSFTVSVMPNLPIGVYSADVLVSADNIETRTFSAAFEVLGIHTVSFNPMNGSAVTETTVAHGAYAEPPSDVKRAGYNLAHWRDEAGAAFNPSAQPVLSDLALYAVWTQGTCTLEFDTAGGTPSSIPSQTVNVGSFTVKPADPVKNGWKFNGWTNAPNGSANFNFAVPLSASLKIYARWLYIYTVTFDSRGGSAADSQSVVDGSLSVKPESAKSGLRFKGWYRNLTDASPFPFDTPITADITLYAKWEADVDFVTNGGSAAAAQTVDEGGFAFEPETAKANAGLEGWYTAGYAAKWDFSSPVNGHTTLYAKWTPYAFGRIAECAAQAPDAASATYTLTGGSETYTGGAWTLTTATVPDIIAIAGGGRTVTGNGNAVTVGSGVTLTLTNITLAKIPIIVSAGGKLVLETGAVIKENTVTGVTVNGGTLEMKTGALVTKNTASVSGGGVRLNGGTFTMSGGEISENTSDVGGGVRLDGGAFTMSGGEISENTSASHGGGVYASGAFTMTGGKISGNKAGPGGWDGTGDGGGVLLTGENTVFNLSGSGEISGNNATAYGGGVRIAFGVGMQVLNQIFNMSGGIIKDNFAGHYGGGLCGGDVLSVFNMTGGEITGNTINYGSGGSGVYIYWTQVSGNPRIGAKANYVGSVYDNPGGDWQ